MEKIRVYVEEEGGEEWCKDRFRERVTKMVCMRDGEGADIAGGKMRNTVFLAGIRSSMVKGATGEGKSKEFVIYSIKTTVPTYLNRVYIQLYLHAQFFFLDEIYKTQREIERVV